MIIILNKRIHLAHTILQAIYRSLENMLNILFNNVTLIAGPKTTFSFYQFIKHLQCQFNETMGMAEAF